MIFIAARAVRFSDMAVARSQTSERTGGSVVFDHGDAVWCLFVDESLSFNQNRTKEEKKKKKRKKEKEGSGDGDASMIFAIVLVFCAPVIVLFFIDD